MTSCSSTVERKELRRRRRMKQKQKQMWHVIEAPSFQTFEDAQAIEDG